MSEETPAPKTPWHPSRRATARVKDPLPAPETCNLCGAAVRIASHEEIYGRAYNEWPWAYRCEGCRAHVGMHPYTAIPLGSLANEEIRRARTLSKGLFEQLWKGGGAMTRTDAYKALAAHMNIPMSACHFGSFDVEQCRVAYRWARDRLRENGHTAQR